MVAVISGSGLGLLGTSLQQLGLGLGGNPFTATGGYASQHYTYVQGQQVGEVDEAGGIDALSGVTGFSNSQTGTQGYVVQAGDTLAGIAQAVYGDASLWYVVADANGLQTDKDLSVGQTLKLPEVTTDSNAAATFKPYNPNAIQGSTTPSLPQAPQPPPSSHGCNVLASIIVIAVAAVVTYFTAGAASGYFDSYVVGGALGGAAGSAASQLAGDALGVSHGFDWGQVVAGAVGGAIGGGLAKAFSVPGSTFASTGGNGIDFAGNAIIGAAGYAGTYEADKLVGEPAHFSWAGLIADSVASGVAGEIGPTKADTAAGRMGGNIGLALESRAVQDVVQREVSVGLGDNHVQSWQQIGEDIFGNALGNAAIAGIEHENAVSEARQQAQLQATAHTMESNFSKELQGNIDAQTGQYIQAQFNAASKADFALMDVERGVITNGIAQYGTGFLAPLAAVLNQSSAANTPMAQVPQSTQAEAGTPGFGTPNDVAYYDQNGVLNIPIVAHIGSKSGPSMYDAIENGVNNVVNGALSTAINMVYQPIAQVHDLGTIAYGLGYQAIAGETYQPNWWSAIGQHADDDSLGTLAENVFSSNPVTGVGVAGWNIGTAIYNGDVNSLETQAGGLIGGFALGKAMAPEVGPSGTISYSDEAAFEQLNAYLAAQDSGYVYDRSSFTPLGVDTATATSYLATQAGQNMLNALGAADPTASSGTLLTRALRQIATGVDVPETQIMTSPLIKIVPEGNTVGANSPFFTTEEVLNNKPVGMTLADYLGLPLGSEAPTYSMYQITPLQPAGVFVNEVAPTTEFNGLIQRQGGAMQYLVPNRSLWTNPQLIGTIPN